MDLDDRRRALEEEFFRKRDAQLLEQLRKSKKASETAKELAASAGIRDEKLLEELTSQGVSSATLAALSLVPLVWVAWADREMSAGEREAILKAAVECGVNQSSAAYGLLESWLTERPPSALYETWTHFVRASTANMDDAAVARLKADVGGRARAVAKAAGGFLGLGAISNAELVVLDKIEASFS